jgi:hypothetical protein
MITSSFFCGFHTSSVCLSPFASMLLSDMVSVDKNVLLGTGRVVHETVGFLNRSDPRLAEEFAASLYSH